MSFRDRSGGMADVLFPNGIVNALGDGECREAVSQVLGLLHSFWIPGLQRFPNVGAMRLAVAGPPFPEGLSRAAGKHGV